MAFSYGKNSLNIKNPFKTEGKLDLIFGIIISILGILLIFKVQNSITSGFQKLAWIELFLSIIFISVGVRNIVVGTIRLFRFLVGREMPSNICPFPYEKSTLERMLMNRTNPTFMERYTLVSRLLISIYDRFLFLPISFRNLVEVVSSSFLSFFSFFIVYLLAIFSTSIGLINLTDKISVITLFTIFFLVKQLFVWYYYRPNKRIILKHYPKGFNYKNLILNILTAIIVPTVFEILIRKGFSFPQININVFLPIVSLFICSISIAFSVYFLAFKRISILNPETEVSEYKEHTQIPIHPADLFRCFDLEMANKRYKEIPNRIYKKVNPKLNLEGSDNKGVFFGSTIQETQPIFIEKTLPNSAKNFRFYIAILGRLLLLASCLYLFFSTKQIEAKITISELFNIFYYPILFSFSGYYFIKIAHIFYSEVLFSSHLVRFFSDGTYSESKISSGMSVYDSNRSENTFVNTSATSWILVTNIISSTMADSTTNNLEKDRYILEMYKSDDFLKDLVVSFNSYLDSRRLTVGFSNKKDIENAIHFHKLNETTRPKNLLDRTIGEHRKDELEN